MSVNKDQVKGRLEVVKGAVKETTGKIVGDKSLELEGRVQKKVGSVQSKLGDIKKDVGDHQSRP